MATECRTLLFQFAVAGKGEHLKATTVGKNWLIPSVEFMQTTSALNDIHTRAQIQMVSVAQNDLRLNIITQFVHVNSLHRAHSAHWHKNWSLDFAVVSANHTRTGFSIFTCRYDFVIHNLSNLLTKLQ